MLSRLGTIIVKPFLINGINLRLIHFGALGSSSNSKFMSSLEPMVKTIKKKADYDFHSNKLKSIVNTKRNFDDTIIIDTKLKDWYDKFANASNEETRKFTDKIIDDMFTMRKDKKSIFNKDGVIITSLKKVAKEILFKFLVILAKIIIAYQIGKFMPKLIELVLIKKHTLKLKL